WIARLRAWTLKPVRTSSASTGSTGTLSAEMGREGRGVAEGWGIAGCVTREGDMQEPRQRDDWDESASSPTSILEHRRAGGKRKQGKVEGTLRVPSAVAPRAERHGKPECSGVTGPAQLAGLMATA